MSASPRYAAQEEVIRRTFCEKPRLNMSEEDRNIHELLAQTAGGNQDAAEQLMPLVYDRLRFLAKKLLHQESPAHTLQPTALVNEAYLRMVGKSNVDWKSRTHFFAIGAKVMRRILVDHARSKKRLKRGGGMPRVEVVDEMCVSHRNDEDVLAIEEAMEKLAKLDQRQAQIVELRFFGGLTVEEVAQVLSVSKRTVEAEWTMVRAWLRRELGGATAE